MMSVQGRYKMSVQGLFKLGMKRDLPHLIYDPYWKGKVFDVGSSGTWKVPGAIALGLPDWSFPRDKIPADDESVSIIHAYHFLEHLNGDDAIAFLREAERVLQSGCVLNYCVPYYNSNLMAQDLTHRSAWCEDTLKNLFNCVGYDPAGSWKLRIHFQMIAGIVERNLCLIGQLVKE